MRRIAITIVAVMLIAGASAPVAGARVRPMTFDTAVDSLIAGGYAKRIASDLCGLGTSPFGFRVGGTTADDAAARYIADQMRAIGLKNVRLEPVAMDVWEYRGGSVAVAGSVYDATSFTGVPGTLPKGVTGEVVDVGFGTAADFDAAGDVHGKIVLVDFHGDAFWANLPGHEATLRGAVALILTTSTADMSFFADPDSLGSNDGEYDPAWIPLVSVSRTTGDTIRAALAGGPVTATVKLDAITTRSFDGGEGYNVVGELPGSAGGAEKVVMAGHHDAFFQGALDNTTAVVAGLVTAKAMKMAGYVPRRTLVFVSHTGEEGGIVDSWYDWTFGSWVQATQTHPEWAGTVAGFLNFEMPGAPDGQVRLFMSPELQPAVSEVVAANGKLKGPGLPTRLFPAVGTNSDEWPFTAAGIPSVLLVGAPDSWFPWNYHTTNDTVDAVDWPFFGTCVKLMHRIGLRLDESLVPYSLAARADQLGGTVDARELTAAGASAATVDRLTRSLGEFTSATYAFEKRRATLPASVWSQTSARLMAIEKLLSSNFTALSWWDDTIYPHEQVLWDLQGVNAAIGALDRSQPQVRAALDALAGVGYSSYGLLASEPVYLHELDRHDPGYWAIAWGGQGHLPQPIDVMPEYRLVGSGDYDAALIGLRLERGRQVGQLNERLAAIADVLDAATPQVDSLR